MRTAFPISPSAAALRTATTATAKKRPHLSDYPDLAVAATTTTAPLDIDGDDYAALMAALETLARLKLGARSTLALLHLCRRETPMTMGEIAKLTRTSTASTTGLVTRLEALGLLTAARTPADKRLMLVRPTEGARRVLASVLALTGWGLATSQLLKQHG